MFLIRNNKNKFKLKDLNSKYLLHFSQMTNKIIIKNWFMHINNKYYEEVLTSIELHVL